MMTDKELVEALEHCVNAVTWDYCADCNRCQLKKAEYCCAKLMLEARDRIAAGMTMRKDDSHER